MAVLGLRGTGDFGVDERPKSFREMILWRNPNGSAPLTALMSKVRSEKLTDPEYNWWEEELNPIRLKVDAAAVGDTDITVNQGDAGDVVAGDLLLVEAPETPINADGTGYLFSDEIVKVISVSGAVLTVARGESGTTPAPVPGDAFVLRIGNSFAEGTRSADASTRNPTKSNNFAQIFKTSYELTKTTEGTTFRTGDPVKNDKKRKMFDHSVTLEHAFLFGKPFEGIGSNGKPERRTGGLLHYLAEASQNTSPHAAIVWNAPPTVDTFLDNVYRVFDYDTGGQGGAERLIFAGNGWLNTLNKISKNDPSSRVNFEGTVKAYGMELMKFILPQGTLYVKSHPLMNVNARWEYSAFVLNPSAIVYRYMRDTMSMDNIQENDADSRKGQWLTEAGLEVHHTKTMQYQGNFRTAP